MAVILAADHWVTCSRYLLAGTCFASAFAAWWRTRTIPTKWRPHLWFTSLWSVVFGIGMWSLASSIEPLDGFFLASINVAATCALFGWASFAIRHDIAARRMMKKINVVSRQLAEPMLPGVTETLVQRWRKEHGLHPLVDEDGEK